MKLIIQNNRVVATATDAYGGESLQAPEGFDESRPFDYVVVDGVVTDTNPPEKQARDAFKASRAAQVAAIQVTTQAGNTFDGDEESQTRMVRAITALKAAQNPEAAPMTITWVLANNVPTAVTAAELTEALVLAGQAQAVLWVTP